MFNHRCRQKTEWIRKSQFSVLRDVFFIKGPAQRGQTTHTGPYDSLPFTFLHVVTKRKPRRAEARVLWNKEKCVSEKCEDMVNYASCHGASSGL